MTEKKFSIVFSGKLVTGSKPPEVLSRLASVLGLEHAQVRELFKPGAGATIRDDMDGSTAYALLEQIQGTGAICTVKEEEPVPAREPPFSGRPHSGKPQRRIAGAHTRLVDKEQHVNSLDKGLLSTSGAPGDGEPLVVHYLPGKKTVVIIVAFFVLWLLTAGINSNEFALHLLSVALLIPYVVLLVECLATRQVTLTADRVVKRRWFFGETTVPASKVIMTADSAKIRFYHGSKQNLRERITVRRSMVDREMFDRLKIAAVSRFDILLKEDKQEGAVIVCEGSGAGRDRKVSALLLGEYHKGVKDYRVVPFLFSLYAIVMVFIVGLSDDFSGIAESIPGDGARFVAILLTVASYLLLRHINPAQLPAATAETHQQQMKLTWEGRLSRAKKSAFHSSLVVINAGTGGFCLFLLTGNLLDFYLFLTVACLFYTDFYPRLSVWERFCTASDDDAPAAVAPLREPFPARRRSLQVSLVLLGTLAVSSYGDSRHYLYKNRKDCLDDWGGNDQDCREPDQRSHYYRSGYWYGPNYGRVGGHPVRSVGSTTVSRGGFGSLGSFHASFGGGHGAS